MKASKKSHKGYKYIVIYVLAATMRERLLKNRQIASAFCASVNGSMCALSIKN